MTAITVPTTDRWIFALRATAGEAAKGLLLIWRRRATLIMSVITLGLTYLMIEYFVGAGQLNHQVLAATLPALFAYALASTAALQGIGGIAEEINGGTLEQAHLTPAPLPLLMLGRLSALAVEGLFAAVVLATTFWAGFGIHYTERPDVLVPLLLTVADTMAYGLVLVALTIAVSSIGAVGHVFNMLVLFFGGTFIPVTAFPHGVEIFARFVPTTLGVQALNVTLSGGSLGTAWADGALPWLVVHATVLTGLGCATYGYVIRSARQEGGLSKR